MWWPHSHCLGTPGGPGSWKNPGKTPSSLWRERPPLNAGPVASGRPEGNLLSYEATGVRGLGTAGLDGGAGARRRWEITLLSCMRQRPAPGGSRAHVPRAQPTQVFKRTRRSEKRAVPLGDRDLPPRPRSTQTAGRAGLTSQTREDHSQLLQTAGREEGMLPNSLSQINICHQGTERCNQSESSYTVLHREDSRSAAARGHAALLSWGWFPKRSPCAHSRRRESRICALLITCVTCPCTFTEKRMCPGTRAWLSVS